MFFTKPIITSEKKARLILENYFENLSTRYCYIEQHSHREERRSSETILRDDIILRKEERKRLADILFKTGLVKAKIEPDTLRLVYKTRYTRETIDYFTKRTRINSWLQILYGIKKTKSSDVFEKEMFSLIFEKEKIPAIFHENIFEEIKAFDKQIEIQKQYKMLERKQGEK